MMFSGHRTLRMSGVCYRNLFDEFCGSQSGFWSKIGVIAIRPTNWWTSPNSWAKAAILFSSFLRSLLVLSCRMYVNNQWLWAVNYEGMWAHKKNKLKDIHPPKQTWNLKMDPWKRRFLLETIISRFHVNFLGSSWKTVHNTFVLQELW